MRNRSIQQRGAVLILALLMMLVMTVLGVSGVGNSILEERMSGNYRQSQSSFQSAEFALKVAENWINTNVRRDNLSTWFDASNAAVSRTGLYSQMLEDADRICAGTAGCTFDPRVIDEWCNGAGCPLQNNFVTLGTNDLATGLLPAVDATQTAFQPQFVIEYLGQYSEASEESSVDGGIESFTPTSFGGGDVFTFKITVIGWGRLENVRTVLMSSYHSPLP